MITGLTSKSGIYDVTPLYDYLTDFVNTHNKTFHKKFVVSAVDVETGSYVTFDETSSDPAKAAQSSSSIPFVFQYDEWANG